MASTSALRHSVSAVTRSEISHIVSVGVVEGAARFAISASRGLHHLGSTEKGLSSMGPREDRMFEHVSQRIWPFSL